MMLSTHWTWRYTADDEREYERTLFVSGEVVEGDDEYDMASLCVTDETGAEVSLCLTRAQLSDCGDALVEEYRRLQETQEELRKEARNE